VGCTKGAQGSVDFIGLALTISVDVNGGGICSHWRGSYFGTLA